MGSNRSEREKDRSYFRLPKITQKQDEEGRIFSKRTTERWVNAIGISDLNLSVHQTRVCSDNFNLR